MPLSLSPQRRWLVEIARKAGDRIFNPEFGLLNSALQKIGVVAPLRSEFSSLLKE